MNLFCTCNGWNRQKVAFFNYLKKISKLGLTPWTKVIMGGKYLVWDGNENFRGFCGFLAQIHDIFPKFPKFLTICDILDGVDTLFL